jgi:putative hemolysin
LPGGHFTTLAGFVVDRLGRTPRRGDSVRALRHRFTVVELDGRRAARIRATPDATDAADGGADAGRVTD